MIAHLVAPLASALAALRVALAATLRPAAAISLVLIRQEQQLYRRLDHEPHP